MSLKEISSSMVRKMKELRGAVYAEIQDNGEVTGVIELTCRNTLSSYTSYWEIIVTENQVGFNVLIPFDNNDMKEFGGEKIIEQKIRRANNDYLKDDEWRANIFCTTGKVDHSEGIRGIGLVERRNMNEMNFIHTCENKLSILNAALTEVITFKPSDYRVS